MTRRFRTGIPLFIYCGCKLFNVLLIINLRSKMELYLLVSDVRPAGLCKQTNKRTWQDHGYNVTQSL